MPNLLLVGPLPPPLGGATISFKLLVDEFENHENYDFLLFNIKSGLSLLKELEQLLKLLRLAKGARVILIHSNSRRISIWTPALVLFSKLTSKQIQFRFFGSDLNTIYQKNVLNRLRLSLLKYADTVLLETKGLVSFYEKNISQNNAFWFPNSRILITHKTELPGGYDRRLQLVYTGHVKVEKGIRVLLDTMENLNAYTDISLKVVGSCEDESLKLKMECLPNVEYLGEMPQGKVGQILKSSDIFVFPSFWEGEGYSGSVIEAMMYGLPVITTDWRFLGELVIDDYNGILVPINNSKALSLAIIKLFEDRRLLSTYSSNSRITSRVYDAKYWNGKRYFELIPKH